MRSMESPAAPARRLVLRGAAGVLLIIVGASAQLWLVFDDRLPTTTPTPGPTGLTVWAVVRLAAAAALAGGTWLAASAMVNRRRSRGR